MANAYSRTTKLKNISGRADYISNPTRQENIVLHEKNMEHDWSEYAEFEKENQRSKLANNQGREIVIALPNELADYPKTMKTLCDDLSKELLGNNRDYEYAVHWNESKTNLHMHLIFSERERNPERVRKTYKRDMWYDKETNKLAKAHAENAELRYKKGDIMKDKEGNIRYTDEKKFTIKDKKFVSKQFLVTQKKIIQKVFRSHDFDISIFDPKNEIAQKKIYKGSSQEYKEYAVHFNQKAKKQNQLFHTFLEIDKPIKQLNEINLQIASTRKELQRRETIEKEKNIFQKLFTKPEEVETLREKITQLIKKTRPLVVKLAKILHIELKELTSPQIAQQRFNAALKDINKRGATMRKELRAINSLSKYEVLNRPKDIIPKKIQQEFSIGHVKELQREIKNRNNGRQTRDIGKSR